VSAALDQKATTTLQLTKRFEIRVKTTHGIYSAFCHSIQTCRVYHDDSQKVAPSGQSGAGGSGILPPLGPAHHHSTLRLPHPEPISRSFHSRTRSRRRSVARDRQDRARPGGGNPNTTRSGERHGSRTAQRHRRARLGLHAGRRLATAFRGGTLR
jgi:hypothetical protein